ncbi:MAG: hypothetical protein M3Y08_14330 [Fibrobacterota bacterium]|nr:hypothetical protein [Fibrobacterota bacterium]
MGSIELRRLPQSLKILSAAFLLSLGLAYAVALLFVFVQTDMKPAGISSQFRGTSETAAPQASPSNTAVDETDEAAVPALPEEWNNRSAGMRFPKSLKDMILTTHLHLLSISMVLFLVGGIFAFSSFPEKAKGPVIAAGFAGLVLTYACMWAVRYASDAFSPGVFLFGLVQACALALQFLASLRDLLFYRDNATPAA